MCCHSVQLTGVVAQKVVIPHASGAIVTLARKFVSDIFLAAAGDTKIHPSECCVIEDAVEGIKAAKAAGMHCIGIAQSFEPSKLAEADLIFDGIDEVTLDLIYVLG